jgi:hypothetical protein
MKQDNHVSYLNIMKFNRKRLSEHKHCDNAATNGKRENARSRMEASSVGKREYRDKGR